MLFSKSLALTLMVALFTGCGSLIGPSNIRNERQDFNVALQQTNDEQMLLNLVRMKYRDTNMFLEVGAIASQYSLTSNVTASGSLTNNFSNSIGLGSKIEYQEKPTISYTPLHGQSFITRLISQVPPQTVGLLYKSGWSVERLFLLCMERIATVQNAPSASGPTPKYAPKFEDFKRLSDLLRDLQVEGGIQLDVVEIPSTKTTGFTLRFNKNVDKTKSDEVRKILGLGQADYYVLAQVNSDKVENEILFETRSIREMLFYLSHGVEVPESHVEKGLVTVTKKQDGSTFDWKDLTGDLMKVKSAKCLVPPTNAYVSVKYRDTWFYIEDNDLNSKSTFSLLIQLYDLQSGDTKDTSPVMTLNVGG
ncbi:MAG: hypothetical protein NE328_17525 [Lentisphaeraceae bacterium]|nr:hypothetical protein [Lentisphaeraceae bacterium]